MSESLESRPSRVQELYKDKTILITGGTGIIGMSLIEKLLRSCPDIRRIYLFMRDKKGQTVDDRVNKLKDNQVFLRIKEECSPELLDKLTGVRGDLTHPTLDLDPRQEEMLIQEVNIVFHCAATVRFTESFKATIGTNLMATRQLCRLAQKMANLKAFIYVSTAYTNCDRVLIPEEVCPVSVDPDKLISLADTLDEEVLELLSKSLCQNKPNHYVFSKCAAENLILQLRASLPIAIFRPSIVTAAAEEPVPGWITSVNGATGTVAGVSAGVMRSIICKTYVHANIVPVDKVVNAIIVFGSNITSQNSLYTDSNDVPLLNYVAKSYNCIIWKDFGNYVTTYASMYPSEKLTWFPMLTTSEHRWSYNLYSLVLQRLPAKIIDFISSKCGCSTNLNALCDSVDKYMDVIPYFSTRQFDFEHNNVDVLWDEMEPLDQQLFHFRMDDIDWDDYMRKYVLGCRKYILNEDESTLERCRSRLKVFYAVHATIKAAILFFSLKLIWDYFSVFSWIF